MKWQSLFFVVKIKKIIIKFIATDKRGYPHNIFLNSPQNICCRYSLEAPRWGTSNEYPQNMFSWRNKKDISIFRWKKRLICCCANCCLLNLLLNLNSRKTKQKKKKKKKKICNDRKADFYFLISVSFHFQFHNN